MMKHYLKNNTVIPVTMEGHETAINGFEYQFTTGKPLKNLKPTLNYYEDASIVSRHGARNFGFFFFLHTNNSQAVFVFVM
jgi:hypothetical protein